MRILVCVFAMMFACATAVVAQDRIALVIGNGSYERVSSLDNPVADAQAMAEKLTLTGFQVTLITDGTMLELSSAISAFGRDLRDAGSDATGLFYYAGHGVQNFGTNYLLPVDVVISDPADLDFRAINAQAVLRQMDSARNATNIFILDACRNNPFDDVPEFGENGLAEMSAPTGTFLAYATAPGAVAFDGDTGNSPFTAALTRRLETPGSPIEEVFRNVRIDVLEKTAGLQTPWDTSSLTSEFVFKAAVQRSPEDIAAEQLWNGVKDSGDPVQILLFLRSYPNSTYIPEARALLNQLLENELNPTAQATPAPAPSGPSDQEQAMIAQAQASGLSVDYQAYLDAFPNGVFAELARSEVATLAAKDPDDRVDPNTVDTAALAPAQPAAPEVRSQGPIEFDQPLTLADPDLNGSSIAQLILGSPRFPPIEGLPDEIWKDKTCSTCHEWTAQALCDQAQSYLTAAGERSLSHQHPYGGVFKNTLKTWAQEGCR